MLGQPLTLSCFPISPSFRPFLSESQWAPLAPVPPASRPWPAGRPMPSPLSSRSRAAGPNRSLPFSAPSTTPTLGPSSARKTTPTQDTGASCHSRHVLDMSHSLPSLSHLSPGEALLLGQAADFPGVFQAVPPSGRTHPFLWACLFFKADPTHRLSSAPSCRWGPGSSMGFPLALLSLP